MKFFCEDCDEEVESGAFKMTIRDEFLNVTSGYKGKCPICNGSLFQEQEFKNASVPIGARRQKPKQRLVIGQTEYFIHGRPKTEVISKETLLAALEQEQELRRNREEEDGECPEENMQSDPE